MRAFVLAINMTELGSTLITLEKAADYSFILKAATKYARMKKSSRTNA